MSADAKPVVVCLLGTDHHPFDRAVEWCDRLATARPDLHVVVQHGWSSPPKVASAQDFFDKPSLTAALGEAHVGISHGGPGLISDVREAGLLPVVVPRDPERGEHVDGHQQRFVRRMAKSGIVDEVASYDDLLAAVVARVDRPRGGIDVDADRSRVEASVKRFAELVDGVLSSKGRD